MPYYTIFQKYFISVFAYIYKPNNRNYSPLQGMLENGEEQTNYNCFNDNSSSFINAISTGFVVNAVSSNDDWPMFHHDLTHTGYSTSTPIATSANLLWNYTTNSVSFGFSLNR